MRSTSSLLLIKLMNTVKIAFELNRKHRNGLCNQKAMFVRHLSKFARILSTAPSNLRTISVVYQT